MNQDKIVVVMGGTSTEAEISRQTGTAILKALQSKGYNAEGMELNPPTFAEDIKKSNCAIVFNALHGKYGEDGVLQGTLDMLGIPYTGSGVLAAAVTMDKAATKRVCVAEGISTPRSHAYHRFEMQQRDLTAEIMEEFGPVLADTCMVVAPIEGTFRRTATNSAKAGNYLPTLCSQKVMFADIPDLLKVIE